MDEQLTPGYEPPMVVALGEFSEDTLGYGTWGPLDAFQFSYSE